VTVEVRRAGDRFRTASEGLESRHSFSFGEHYDPANLGFGLLVAHNEDVVAPGNGYDTHPHRDLEIVTWVLGGRLRHTDSGGTSGVVYRGLAQRLSAGSGILHAERTDGDEPVHFVQMWVRPDQPGLTPGYAQHDVSADLASGELVPVASGTRSDAAIRINQPAADFFVARLRPGTSVSLPGAAYVHLFVAQGTAELEGTGELGAGDAARITDGGVRVTGDAEVLVWTFRSRGRG
jgi:redox-sensitive bicupin YhaK (pirin superfamily)